MKTKKAWFEANQARVTAENITKAEADIKRLTGASKSDTKGEPTSASAVTPPNGGGEVPAEPAPTPKVADIPDTAVPSSEVVEKLEDVQEQEAAEAES